MRSSVTFWFLLVALLGNNVATTLARPQYRPLFPYKQGSCGTDFDSSEEAAVVPNPYVSWAFYHYFDCTSRAVWTRLDTPAYGPGVITSLTTTVPTRFFNVSMGAVIVGPGLPPLPDATFQALPAAVREDIVWNTTGLGALYIDKDYSACRYFGPHYSSHYNGTHCIVTHHVTGSQLLLSAHLPRLRLPVGNATYHVTVFPLEDVSVKTFIALGAHAVDFVTPYELPQPTCERNVQQDFYERLHPNTTASCFPQVTCPATIATCAADNECVLDNNSTTADDLANIHDDLGSCGGDDCPAAVDKWYDVLHPLLETLTDFEYTGNVAIDLVRGLIPLQMAAVELCRTLLEDLECVDSDNDEDDVDGLAEFCQHVNATAADQVEQMTAWLEDQGLNATASCGDNDDRRNLRAIVPYSHAENEACGETDATSSHAFMHANKRLQAHLALGYSCHHTTDFVRLAMPRHAAAFDRCATAMRYYHHRRDEDPKWFIPTLCANVTQSSAREIAWMYGWLKHRHLPITTHCPDCDDSSSSESSGDQEAFVAPCEDLLPMTAFCHDTNLGLCHCSALHCHAPPLVFPQYGVLDPRVLCKRTCGQCPSDMTTVWMHTCPATEDDGIMSTSGSASSDAAATADTSSSSDEGRTANIAAISDEPGSSAAISVCGIGRLGVALFLAVSLLFA